MTMTCLPVARIWSGNGVSLVDLVLQRQELHGEMDSLELAAGDRQVAGLRGAAGEHDGVVVVCAARRPAR